ncbi:CPXCG motif-containing cysteine-rich protein [Aporhodopirellula aestuarii]|uniref:CPXCG motif-containing cysteine-rich protein n=1 Tax=Aporhodopirellula aestuarii TaxID=2950107 RepID=A0ABT0U7H9_9BACT|nr:CPXCG motif-containing cysteine-rich protein [Aporhodopirellula aestuarii]MCM2372890.1 CPXCG motif-containing cysteine-rich protein [Aporhodopirellula aestuarii]
MSEDDINFDDESNETSLSSGAFDDDANLAHVDEDATYICDNCGEEIVIPVDLAGGQDQTYVEDCPVCCSPSVIHVHVDDDHVDVRAEPEQDRF